MLCWCRCALSWLSLPTEAEQKNYGNRVRRKEKGGFNTQPTEGRQAASSCLNCPPFPPSPLTLTMRSLGGLYKMRAHSQAEGMRKKVVRTLSSSLVLFQNKMIMGWCRVTPGIGSITLLPSFCNANREELPLVVFEVSCKGEHQTQDVINIELKDGSKLSYRQQMRLS